LSRIRNLADTRVYIPKDSPEAPLLAPWVGGTINTALIAKHWDEILRLKLSGYPRQTGLALALRELGRLERTFFTRPNVVDSRSAQGGEDFIAGLRISPDAGSSYSENRLVSGANSRHSLVQSGPTKVKRHEHNRPFRKYPPPRCAGDMANSR
jgi:hypothetical protein